MFEPYHKFASCHALRALIKEFVESGKIDEATYQAHLKYHYTVYAKLYSAKQHFENLKLLLDSTELAAVDRKVNEFSYQVNTHLDSFFYCGGSVFDILSHEVLAYYNLTPSSGRIYFSTARDKISQTHSGNQILPKLQDPTWYDDFKEYRNALTHEVSLASKIHAEMDMGPSPKKTIKLIIPDDPRTDFAARTYDKRVDAVDYCHNHLKRLIRFTNLVYAEVVNQAKSKDGFPIP